MSGDEPGARESAPPNQPPAPPPQSAPAQASAATPVHDFALAHYSSDSGPTYTEAARVLTDTFGKLGITVKPQPMQFNTFVNTVQSGGKIEDMALGVWGGEPDRMDPHHWIREANHSKAIRNSSHYNNAEYDRLAEAQDVELDVAKRKAIISQAQQLHAKEEPYWLSDRIAVMYLGRIVEYGPTESVLTSPRHPYARALMAAVPDPDPGATRPRVGLVGEVPSALNIPSGCRFRTRCPHVMPICHNDAPVLKEVAPAHFAACYL